MAVVSDTDGHALDEGLISALGTVMCGSLLSPAISSITNAVRLAEVLELP